MTFSKRLITILEKKKRKVERAMSTDQIERDQADREKDEEDAEDEEEAKTGQAENIDPKTGKPTRKSLKTIKSETPKPQVQKEEDDEDPTPEEIKKANKEVGDDIPDPEVEKALGKKKIAKTPKEIKAAIARHKADILAAGERSKTSAVESKIVQAVKEALGLNEESDCTARANAVRAKEGDAASRAEYKRCKEAEGDDARDDSNPANQKAKKVLQGFPKTGRSDDGPDEAKDWINKAADSIEDRGTEGKCTPITKKGCTGRAKALAKTFKKIGKKRDAATVSKKEKAAKK